MVVDSHRASARWISALIAMLAIVLLAHASRAGEEPQPRSLEGAGQGTLTVWVAFGGELSAVLEGAAGEPHLLLRAALYDVQHYEGQPWILSARMDGVLVDPATLERRGTIEGELMLAEGRIGRWHAVIHPVSGPDPWKVDAGAIEGWVQLADDGPSFVPTIQGRTLIAWSLVEAL